MTKVCYICDPDKNTSCSKAGCRIFNCCQCTTNPKYAKTGQNGKPIVAVRSDLIAGEKQP